MNWLVNGNNFTSNIRPPKSFFIENYSTAMLRSFSTCVAEAISLEQGVLPVYIESNGGEAFILSGVLSLFDSARRSGLKISTIVSAKAFSAGALTFCYGDDGLRFMGSEATIMLHPLQMEGLSGPVGNIKSSADFFEAKNKVFYEKISRNLKKRPNWLEKKMNEAKDGDWFLDAETSLKEGLASCICIPTFKVDLKAEISVIS